MGYNRSFCLCMATNPDMLTTLDNTVTLESKTLPEVFVDFTLDSSYYAPG